MNRILVAAIILSAVTACDRQVQAPIESVVEAPASGVPEQPVPAVAGPIGKAFDKALPEGVVLQVPFNATLDLPVENRGGSMGRRTEFEYLEGDAAQAMAGFAEAMQSAGFESIDGPSSEEGVIRQVFRKLGYGRVFARAQERPGVTYQHSDARGFLVVAWPSNNGAAEEM